MSALSLSTGSGDQQLIFTVNPLDGKVASRDSLAEAESRLFQSIMNSHMVIMRPNKGDESKKEELVEGWSRPMKDFHYSDTDKAIQIGEADDIVRGLCKHVIGVIQGAQAQGVEGTPFPFMRRLLDGSPSSAHPKMNIDAFEGANPIKKAVECGILEALIYHVRHPDFIDTEEKLMEKFGNFESSLSEGWKKQNSAEDKKKKNFKEDLPRLRTFYNAMIHCNVMNVTNQRIVERIKEYILTVIRHPRKGLSNGGNRNVASDCRSEMIRQHFGIVKRKGQNRREMTGDNATDSFGVGGTGILAAKFKPTAWEKKRKRDMGNADLVDLADMDLSMHANTLVRISSSDGLLGFSGAQREKGGVLGKRTKKKVNYSEEVGMEQPQLLNPSSSQYSLLFSDGGSTGGGIGSLSNLSNMQNMESRSRPSMSGVMDSLDMGAPNSRPTNGSGSGSALLANITTQNMNNIRAVDAGTSIYEMCNAGTSTSANTNTNMCNTCGKRNSSDPLFSHADIASIAPVARAGSLHHAGLESAMSLTELSRSASGIISACTCKTSSTDASASMDKPSLSLSNMSSSTAGTQSMIDDGSFQQVAANMLGRPSLGDRQHSLYIASPREEEL